MSNPLVVWIGEQPPFQEAPGLRVARARGAGDAVLDGADVIFTPVAHVGRLVPLGAKLVAVVATLDDAGRALELGAHDAIVDAGEALLRARLWARIAVEERLLRGSLTALGERVRVLETQVADMERESQTLRQLAHRDELTGLGNRRSFRAQLAYALDYAKRYGGPVSVVLADLDGMKRLNDVSGHPAGDAALRTVAEELRAALRSTDHAARLGGDEFGIVMPATSARDAALVAERIRERIAAVMLPSGMRLSASFGVADLAPARAGSADADALVERADAALYDAKRGGRNRVSVDDTRRAA